MPQGTLIALFCRLLFLDFVWLPHKMLVLRLPLKHS